MRRKRTKLSDGREAEIEGDGRTVWLNAPECLARFGLAGIDIHRGLAKQEEEGECLYCTHEITTPADWKTFVEKVKEFYGVLIPEKFRPLRLRTH